MKFLHDEDLLCLVFLCLDLDLRHVLGHLNVTIGA